MHLRSLHIMIASSLGLEPLQNFEIKCVKYDCLIISAKLIERKFRSFALIAERAFLISSFFQSYSIFIELSASFQVVTSSNC